MLLILRMNNICPLPKSKISNRHQRTYMFNGYYLSLSGCSSGGLECLLGVQEVARSSRVTPTKRKARVHKLYPCFLIFTGMGRTGAYYEFLSLVKIPIMTIPFADSTCKVIPILFGNFICPIEPDNFLIVLK